MLENKSDAVTLQPPGAVRMAALGTPYEGERRDRTSIKK